jgi:Icc-related predicted phosphoesterase
VYNESLEEHMDHLCCVLYVLSNEKLYAKLKKCTFCMVKVVFLGYVVSEKSIEMVKKLYERQIKKKNKQYVSKANKDRRHVIFEPSD